MSRPSSQNRLRILTTVRLLFETASAIRSSVCPSSVLSRARARFTVLAADLPRLATSLRRRSWDSLNSTLYLLAVMFGNNLAR